MIYPIKGIDDSAVIVQCRPIILPNYSGYLEVEYLNGVIVTEEGLGLEPHYKKIQEDQFFRFVEDNQDAIQDRERLVDELERTAARRDKTRKGTLLVTGAATALFTMSMMDGNIPALNYVSAALGTVALGMWGAHNHMNSKLEIISKELDFVDTVQKYKFFADCYQVFTGLIPSLQRGLPQADYTTLNNIDDRSLEYLKIELADAMAESSAGTRQGYVKQIDGPQIY